MSMTISSNSTGVNGRKNLKISRTSIKRLLINQIALMTNSSRHSQSSFFIKSSFSEPRWPIAALNHKKKHFIILIIIIVMYVIIDLLFI